jgi:hypothetical protein
MRLGILAYLKYRIALATRTVVRFSVACLFRTVDHCQDATVNGGCTPLAILRDVIITSARNRMCGDHAFKDLCLLELILI